MIRDFDGEQKPGRRNLLKGLGLAGLGAALWPARSARASVGPAPGQRPATTVLESADGQAVLRTGPFQTFGATAGARIGVCFLVAGAVQAAGPRPLLKTVHRAAGEMAGLESLEADPAVERGVYRLLDGLNVVRPVELFGLSGKVGRNGLEAGGSVEIVWEASLRGQAVTSAQLDRYLQGFHACVIGELAEDSRFTGQMSYIEIARQL